jgi:hypothetical protein
VLPNISLFVERAFKAQAATKASPVASVVQSSDGSTGGGYWAAWSEAASH